MQCPNDGIVGRWWGGISKSLQMKNKQENWNKLWCIQIQHSEIDVVEGHSLDIAFKYLRLTSVEHIQQT